MSMLSTDRVRVFVSSTLHECSEERRNAKTAIFSVNHHAIVFEELGARPHPARSTYQQAIEESDIFIGIYKSSYGYIAEGMEISGIEDEYTLAVSRGMPRLIYVCDCLTQREERLSKLLAEIEQYGSVTYSRYSTAECLYEQIRNDVTTTVSSRFHASDPLGHRIYSTPRDILNTLIPPSSLRLRRPEVENRVFQLLTTSHSLELFGPLGCGKTVLLLLLANDNAWTYVNARGRSIKEIMGYTANQLFSQLKRQAIVFKNVETAERALIEAWEATISVTLAIDNCDDIFSVLDCLAKAGGVTAEKRVVFTKRTPQALPSSSAFPIPKLTKNEVSSFLEWARKVTPSMEELDEVFSRSGGNPLYLRYYSSGNPGKFENDLKSYEIREWKRLSHRTREALSYLVLAGTPLALGNLHKLIGDKACSVEEIAEALSAGAHLLQSGQSHYGIFHEHFGSTIGDLIKAQPPLHQFYAHSLGQLIYKQGDPLNAYMILDAAKDPLALKILHEAEFDAVSRGEVTRGIHISNRALEEARAAKDAEATIHALLRIAHWKQQFGDVSSALNVFQEAEVEAKNLNKSDWLTLIKEQRICAQLLTDASKTQLDELAELQEQYKAANDEYGVARICGELSACHIRSSSYEEAAEAARKALALFQKLGDTYGVMVAKNNLLSSLSALSTHKEETAVLLAEVSSGFDKERMPRQRAFLCNLYARQHREQGNPDLARQFSQEAIDIGTSLGDLNLVMINRINLGNAYRDAGLLEKALAQYTEVSTKASAAGYKLAEAHANEAMAQIHNLLGNYRKAEIHATYAISLARDTSDIRTLVQAYEQRGEAYSKAGKRYEAALDFLQGAKALKVTDEVNNRRLDLVEKGLWLIAEERLDSLLKEYIAVLLQDGVTSAIGSATIPELLFNTFPDVLSQIPVERVIDFSGLLFRILFNGIPEELSKPLTNKLVARLQPKSLIQEDVNKAILAIGTLLTAVPSGPFKLSDVVEIAEGLTTWIDGMHFKPRNDGAAYWNIRLNLSKPVICTIGQLDDRPDIALITIVMALLFKGLEKQIQDELLLVENPRTEVVFQVINVDELRATFPDTALSTFGMTFPMNSYCQVSRSTDPSTSDQPPTLVICRGDLTHSWEPGHRRGSSLQILLGLVLQELVYTLLNGAIELETIRPKVISVVRETLS